MAAAMEVHAEGATALLYRPCVECGLSTGNYCDDLEVSFRGPPCLAKERVPKETWAPGQRTPLCSVCERKYVSCRYCRRVSGCSPPAQK